MMHNTMIYKMKSLFIIDSNFKLPNFFQKLNSELDCVNNKFKIDYKNIQSLQSRSRVYTGNESLIIDNYGKIMNTISIFHRKKIKKTMKHLQDKN